MQKYKKLFAMVYLQLFWQLADLKLNANEEIKRESVFNIIL